MQLKRLSPLLVLLSVLPALGCHSHDDDSGGGGGTGSTIVDTANSTVELSTAADIVADGVESTTLTVTVLDFQGMPLTGWNVTPAISGSDNVLMPPSGVTDAAGVFQAQLTSTTAEVKQFTVTVSGAETAVLQSRPTAAFIGDLTNIGPGLTTVTASPAFGIEADGVETSTITITVLDANGNPVPNAPVALSATGTGNTLTQPMPTGPDGVTTATLASTVEETKTLTATVDPMGSATVVTMQPTVTFGDAGIDDALSSFTVTPSFGVLADGSATATVSATILDQAGQPAVGETVMFSATGRGNTLTPPSAVTDANGMVTATLTSTVAEIKTLTATVDPSGTPVVLDDAPATQFVWPLPNTWYVRTGGSDANDGMSPAEAFATLGAAGMAAGPGDTIYVGGGVHMGPVDVTSGGTPGDPTRWIADPFGTFTGDAGEVVVDGGGADYAMQLSGAADVVIDGFTFTGAGGAAFGAVDVVGASDRAVITRNRMYGNANGIRISGADSAILEDNRISNNTAAGALLEAGADLASVTNNLVYGNGAEGIRADAVSGLTVQLNTLYRNGGAQLMAQNGASVTATDNIVADGLGDGLALAGGGTTLTSDHNDSFGNAGQNWQGLAQGANDISVDPLFEDPDGADNALGGANGDDDRLQVDQSGPSQTLDVGSADAGTLTLNSGDTATDRTTRSDDLLDGEAPDGVTVNMGYHFRPAIDPLAPLELDDGRLFYGEGASSRPRVRDWDDSASSWGAEMPTAPASSRIQFAVHEQSIIADGEEYLVIQSTDGTSTILEMVTWTGSEWRREWTNDDIAAVHGDKRGFDFGFEQSSAHGLLVQSDGSDTPIYRTRELGRWSDPLPLPLNDGAGPNPDINTGIVLWVEIIEKPNSDEITLLYGENNSDLVAIVWDGTQWLTGTAALLDGDLKTNPISGFVHSRAFDGAYESLSGDFVATWGREFASGFFFATRASGAGSFSAVTNVLSMNGRTHYCDLASEPGTDRIAAGLYDLGDGTERLSLSTWDGSAWQDTVEIDSQILDVNDMGTSDFPGEVAWLGTTGQAVCVYPDNQAATLDWATWTAGTGWTLGTDIPVPGKGTTESALLRPFTNQDRVLTVFSDSNGGLYSATFDGTTWTLTNGGNPVETDLSTIGAAPFSFAFER